MRAAIGLVSAIIVPLFAESGPVNPDAVPAWGLAGAIIAFLSGLLWTFRQGLGWARSGIQVFYAEVAKPTADAHTRLVNTLEETRKTDSKSIAILAEKASAIHNDLIEMREAKCATTQLRH